MVHIRCTDGPITAPRRDIAVGVTGAMVLSGDTLLHWGSHRFGLGGDVWEGTHPVVSSLPIALESIETRENLTCGLMSAGGVACWGSDAGDFSSQDLAMVPGTEAAMQLSVGGAHACALNLDGTIVCWGRNSNAQLGGGFGTATNPVTVGAPGDYIAVASGARGSCGTRIDRSIRCWGDTFGEFPTAVWPGEAPDEIAMGGSEGTTFVCGRFGEVVRCTGEFATHQLTLAAVSISAGATEFCVHSVAGTVECWGYRPIAGDSSSTVPSAYSVHGLPRGDLELGLGAGYGCARLGTQVFCWGQNDMGQLGQGNTSLYPLDTALDVPL